MDFLGTLFTAIIDALVTLYLAPIEMLIDPYDNYELVFGLFFFALLYLLTALIAYLILHWMYHKIRWYSKRQRCQHKECGQQWTTGMRHGNRIGCRNEQPCCSDCDDRHADEDAERAADAEERINCPRGHGPMEKVLDGRIATDICSTCSFVGLETEELRALLERAEQKGYNNGLRDGKSSGQATGLAVGIATGSAIG